MLHQELSPTYLDYLVIAFQLMSKQENHDFIQGTYYRTTNEMLKENIFNNHNELLNYNKQQIKLFISNELAFREKPKWMENSTIEYDIIPNRLS